MSGGFVMILRFLYQEWLREEHAKNMLSAKLVYLF